MIEANSASRPEAQVSVAPSVADSNGDRWTKAGLVARIQAAGLPVVVFGVGTVGRVVREAARRVGLHVDCYCDNNSNKTDRMLDGIEVVHTSALRKYPDAIFLVSAADLADVAAQLKQFGFHKWYSPLALIEDFEPLGHDFGFGITPEFIQYSIATCMSCHDAFLNPDKVFLRSIDIIVTERCSLKCVSCSNLMQYYEKPTDCSTEDLLTQIDVFCSLVDEVNEFRLIGGEPFMNKDLGRITQRLLDEPKARRVVFYTNATILPRPAMVDIIRNPKVLFVITDYGELSRNRDALIAMLEENKIAYYIERAQGWTECSTIVRHDRTEEGNKQIFRDCCAKNTVTLSDGVLHRCPFSANVERLEAIPEFPRDRIDLVKEEREATDKSALKRRIRSFLLDKETLDVCDFCEGRSFDAPEITPGIQVKKPLEYIRYRRADAPR